jgi:hypothetical protein
VSIFRKNNKEIAGAFPTMTLSFPKGKRRNPLAHWPQKQIPINFVQPKHLWNPILTHKTR